MTSTPTTRRERFEAKYAERGNGCWEWTAACFHNGYGKFRDGTKIRSAHRVAYEIYCGSIGSSTVCHRCDNPLCVNPNHLFLGTQKDNVSDMISKGRQAVGERFSSHKLTPSGVREIRERYNAGGVTQQALAEEFGVDQKLISRVVRRLSWKHVK